jgi:hypothetical protein
LITLIVGVALGLVLVSYRAGWVNARSQTTAAGGASENIEVLRLKKELVQTSTQFTFLPLVRSHQEISY